MSFFLERWVEIAAGKLKPGSQFSNQICFPFFLLLFCHWHLFLAGHILCGMKYFIDICKIAAHGYIFKAKYHSTNINYKYWQFDINLTYKYSVFFFVLLGNSRKLFCARMTTARYCRRCHFSIVNDKYGIISMPLGTICLKQ